MADNRYYDYPASDYHRDQQDYGRDYGAGLLKSAVLVRVPMSRTDWMIRLLGRKGDEGMLLDVATLEPAVYRSLDRAAAALEQIGFAIERLQSA